MWMRLALLLSLSLAWLACPTPIRAQPLGAHPVDAIVADVATLAEPTQRYSLYLPPGYASSRRWPVLILLDARGRGESTLRLAEAAARRNGWIVLSSRNSQSDVDETITLRALQALLRETGQRYAYDPRRIYLAGFSGTAKTLWTQVEPLRQVIAGMLGSGGGRPAELGGLRHVPPAFFGTAGTTDFNYREMLDLDASLARAAAVHRFEAFDGGHGWPPAPLFAEALDWFDLMAMRDGRSPRDEARIDAYWQARQASLPATDDPHRRWQALQSIVRDFSGLRDVASLQLQAEDLARQPAVLARQAQEVQLRREEAADARRLDAWIGRIDQREAVRGQRRDPPLVGQALRELRVASLQSTGAGADPAEAASARRRLERIGVAVGFYLPQRYLAQGDTARAAALLEIALAIHPGRGVTHWQLAGLHARAGRVDKAFASLAQARRLGYVDLDGLRTDPHWRALHDDPRWLEATAPGH